ncbi:hypothetical protein CENDO_09700 [Corynebacterium endometrii]|uniref:Uncharacterized protein n=1 Tax=Corynebacterium endometrii TaxID=2488819 RepID=A0A4P7QJR5_9CORY|nr:hypothetical protein CENDO_09700 [Corynebacterium endometrii]
MLVVVIAVCCVAVAIVDVVNMVTVGDCHVAAIGAVDMVWVLVHLVGLGFALIPVAVMLAVDVAVMDVIDVIAVLEGDVAAAFAVDVLVIVVGGVSHDVLLGETACSAADCRGDAGESLLLKFAARQMAFSFHFQQLP